MAVRIDDIFSTYATSVREFLIENGQGCYIPVYQRPYSWDRNDIKRLCDDTLNGLHQLLLRRDATSFIGTIIAIHDNEYRTVEPIYKNDLPQKVMTIIDGQQRICTAIMLNIALHNYIGRRLATLPSGRLKEPHFAWINDRCRRLLSDLAATYRIDMHGGDDQHQYYPRVIRALADAWSTRAGQARYTSSMAKLIWDYITVELTEGAPSFRFDPRDESGDTTRHKFIEKSFKSIQNLVQDIAESSRVDFPSILPDEKDGLTLFQSIFGVEVDDCVFGYLRDAADEKHSSTCTHLLRAMIFAGYFNQRTALTVVKARNEDDAFDMFDSLNTTGQLLTALETFTPKVIQAEGLAKYSGSPSKQYMDGVDEYLNEFPTAKAKQAATAELLIAFALKETGWKLQGSRHEQRLYLRGQFDQLGKASDSRRLQREFVESMASVAAFMRHAWKVGGDDVPRFEPLGITETEAVVGFEVLRDMNHGIVIAPLARFYQRACQMVASGEGSEGRALFEEALRATVAFSILWRGAKGGTQNIDGHYRDLMKKGYGDGEGRVPALSRRLERGIASAVPRIKDYKDGLRKVLEDEGGIGTKERWISEVCAQKVYVSSAPMARFLLFCALEDGVADPGEPGQIRRGKRGVAPMLTVERWRDERYGTVEHIAPKSRGDGWDERIYEPPEVVDTLGNLNLLPAEVNSVINDRSWSIKRLMYRLLCAETEEESRGIAESLKGELGSGGQKLSGVADEVLLSAPHLGIYRSVGAVAGEWTREMVEARGRRLASLAWDRMAPWLQE